MKQPCDLSESEKEAILERIQAILWLDADGNVDHDLEWDSETLTEIGLAMAPLSPEKP